MTGLGTVSKLSRNGCTECSFSSDIFYGESCASCGKIRDVIRCFIQIWTVTHSQLFTIKFIVLSRAKKTGCQNHDLTMENAPL
jgi:hypothetical protein